MSIGIDSNHRACNFNCITAGVLCVTRRSGCCAGRCYVTVNVCFVSCMSIGVDSDFLALCIESVTARPVNVTCVALVCTSSVGFILYYVCFAGMSGGINFNSLCLALHFCVTNGAIYNGIVRARSRTCGCYAVFYNRCAFLVACCTNNSGIAVCTVGVCTIVCLNTIVSTSRSRGNFACHTMVAGSCKLYIGSAYFCSAYRAVNNGIVRTAGFTIEHLVLDNRIARGVPLSINSLGLCVACIVLTGVCLNAVLGTRAILCNNALVPIMSCSAYRLGLCVAFVVLTDVGHDTLALTGGIDGLCALVPIVTELVCGCVGVGIITLGAGVGCISVCLTSGISYHGAVGVSESGDFLLGCVITNRAVFVCTPTDVYTVGSLCLNLSKSVSGCVNLLGVGVAVIVLTSERLNTLFGTCGISCNNAVVVIVTDGCLFRVGRIIATVSVTIFISVPADAFARRSLCVYVDDRVIELGAFIRNGLGFVAYITLCGSGTVLGAGFVIIGFIICEAMVAILAFYNLR